MLTCPSWENLCEHWALWHIYIKAASELVFIFQVNGIEEFFRPTCLNGEHQMYCDRCGHKVDATIVNEEFFVISEHWYWFNEIITKWHTLKTHIFHSDRCNKTSPRCFDSAAEEVWVQLQLHVLLQNQLFCGGSLQPANTGGIYKVYFNIWSKSSSFSFSLCYFLSSVIRVRCTNCTQLWIILVVWEAAITAQQSKPRMKTDGISLMIPRSHR